MVLPYLLVFIYTLAIIYITVYCLMQVQLLYFYTRPKVQEKGLLADLQSPKKLPFVTIQLPIFNERYVVERLIDNIAKMDYPKECFEIQVLDDSTDETVEISRRKVEEYKGKGYNIELVHRIDRQGYKAGALRDGLHKAKGKLVAIFDADFLPNPDFLKKTVSYFNNENVGVVQTRWEHINKDYSLLTQMQAMQLDVHFTVEQRGRKDGKCLLQFNGTAGLWRRETIDDAGGWEADTLTEDLDLSYRAQIKGWKIIYLQDVTSPAELPAEMNGLKSQQFRWTKGGAETARKMLPTIWQSNLSRRQKIHASAHLLSSSVFISILLTAVLSVPLMFLFEHHADEFSYGYVFYIALVGVSMVYYVANVHAIPRERTYLRSVLKFLFLFPVFLSLSMGLSLHNTIAAIQGLLGKQTAFIRTPKFNIIGISDTFKKQHYYTQKIDFTTIMEGLLAVYFAIAVYYGFFVLNNIPFVVYHSMLAFGFGTIFYYSIRHLRFK